MYGFDKLKQNYEFHRAYNRGIACVTPAFVLYVIKGRKNKVRLGITVTKKIGGAVDRNRAKRVITAAFAEIFPKAARGYDYVVVARARVLEAKSTKISEALERELKKNGFWCEQ